MYTSYVYIRHIRIRGQVSRSGRSPNHLRRSYRALDCAEHASAPLSFDCDRTVRRSSDGGAIVEDKLILTLSEKCRRTTRLGSKLRSSNFDSAELIFVANFTCAVAMPHSQRIMTVDQEVSRVRRFRIIRIMSYNRPWFVPRHYLERLRIPENVLFTKSVALGKGTHTGISSTRGQARESTPTFGLSGLWLHWSYQSSQSTVATWSFELDCTDSWKWWSLVNSLGVSVVFFRDSLGMNYMFGFTTSIRMKIFSYPWVLSVWYVAILRYIAPAEAIRLLLQAGRNRASIMMKTRDEGMLPLHIACQHHLNDDSFQLLLDSDTCKRSVLVSDNFGELPLHAAVRRYRTSTEISGLSITGLSTAEYTLWYWFSRPCL